MELKSFVVVPNLEGTHSVHVYRAETPRDAVQAHGKPGEWIVLEGAVWVAWLESEESPS